MVEVATLLLLFVVLSEQLRLSGPGSQAGQISVRASLPAVLFALISEPATLPRSTLRVTLLLKIGRALFTELPGPSLLGNQRYRNKKENLSPLAQAIP